jgi:hypothetical protein
MLNERDAIVVNERGGQQHGHLQFPTSLVRDVLPALVGAFPFLDGAS